MALLSHPGQSAPEEDGGDPVTCEALGEAGAEGPWYIGQGERKLKGSLFVPGLSDLLK